MPKLTRRGLLQTGIAISALHEFGAGEAQARAEPAPLSAASSHARFDPLRERLLLDFGWRFHFGHADDPDQDFGFGSTLETYAKAGGDIAAAAKSDFDDSAWDAIDLPHDWAVALPFVPSTKPPPQGQDDPRAGHGFKPLGRDFPATSIGWYRRSFDLPASEKGKRVALDFDGVFRNCMVLFNGFIVGSEKSGYLPFSIDVTDYCNFGGSNLITVRVDASLGEGWFYEGAGIYRHVWLTKTEPVHLAEGGTFVRSDLQGADAALALGAEISNAGTGDTQCRVVWRIEDPHGVEIAVCASAVQRLKAGETAQFTGKTALRTPALWSIETPHLHRLVCELEKDGRIVERSRTPFGIRTIRFDAENGFFLNGKSVKLKGTCNHQDHAGLGTALPDRMQEFRIEKLKAMGSNAYRSSHNPPAPELLDACDRLGMLVIDETRMMASDTEGLDQLSRMIRRDRNHPSIILWSIGNEEHELQGTSRGAQVATRMKHQTRALDPTRPITAAVDDSKAWGIGITPLLDVLGCNYHTDKIPAFHKRFPDKPVIGTETASTVCTRGIYARDEAKGFVPAYDTDAPPWATTAEAWLPIAENNPFMAGGFVWTGFDYRGEPTPFNRWPNVASQFGIMDSCGFPKDNWFYYRAWWSEAPLLHLFPHWNWAGKEGQAIDVWCHSNLDRVELFLNGHPLGVKTVPRYGHVQWQVPYAPGTLEARGYRNGALVLTERRETTGAPAAVALDLDRKAIAANAEDVCVVTARIVDAHGRTVPIAGNNVRFRIDGPGRVIGVGNGDPTSHEADKADHRRAFNGLCMAIVQADRKAGNILVTALSDRLASGRAEVTAQAATPRPYI